MATSSLEAEQLDRMKVRFEALRAEYHVCKRKLESKCQALLILSKELDQCRSERDQFKLMAEQLQERYQNIKRQLGQPCYPSSPGEKSVGKGSTKNLGSLLFECRERNKSLEFEMEDLKQKLQDANGDIKLLREQIARQRVGTSDEGINIRHFPAHEREDLVKQLEASREEFYQLERDLQQVIDEKEELVTERVAYKTKYDRLNQELNYILKGDEKRIVDIDALCMENKYLQERLKQMTEEKSMAMATVSKYKSLLERKKTKNSSLKLGQSRSGPGLVITQKQVHKILEDHSQVAATPQAMADLQALASALLETVNDKNLALSHQRKTNKILGNRVAELEKKIKTLEVAGLWNVPDNLPNFQKLRAECEDVKTLIPQMSQSSDDTSHDPGQNIEQGAHDDLESELCSLPSSTITSPTHSISSNITPSQNESPIHNGVIENDISYLGEGNENIDLHNTMLSADGLVPPVTGTNVVSMDDLDLLPTKEEIVRCMDDMDDFDQSKILTSGSQLTDIAINEQLDHDDEMSEEKLKSLMDDMTNKMVEFTHKTKHRGHFLDRIQETGDSQTSVNVRSKSLEEKDSQPTTPTDPLVQETLLQKSNEKDECC